jgi:hypothetical protein
MKRLPLYDKELYIRMQVFEWLFSADDLLNNRGINDGEEQNKENLNISKWERKIKQVDNLLQQL